MPITTTTEDSVGTPGHSISLRNIRYIIVSNEEFHIDNHSKSRAEAIEDFRKTFFDSEGAVKLIEINAEKERWTTKEIAYIVNGELTMQIKHHIYSVNYCSVEVPKELYEEESIPNDLKECSVEPYARLKDGIEIGRDNLQDLMDWNDKFNQIAAKWQEFLKEVLKIKADTYIFHN